MEGVDEAHWPEPVEPMWLETVIDRHPLVALGLVVVLVAVVAGGRLIGEPPLVRRRPRLVLGLELVSLPLLIIVAGMLAAEAMQALGLADVREVLDRVRIVLLYLAGFWLLARGLDLFFWRGWLMRRTGRATPGLVRNLTYAALMLPTLALVLWWSGYSVSGVLLSTGVFAALVGLALQSTLADLFSGIALSLEQPFEIGDWIELEDGTVGEVTDITWRSTQLVSFHSSLLVVPNGKMAGQRLQNLSRPDRRYAAWFEVKLPPEVEPRLASELLTEAAVRCKVVLKRPPPVVRLADATTRPYTYMVWVHFPTFLGHFRGREELFRQIDLSLQQLGIRPAVSVYDVGVARSRPVHVEPPTIAHALRSVDLFSVLDDEQIGKLALASQQVTVEAGEVLMRQGQPVEAIHVLMSGLLEESLTLPNGRRVVTQTLEPGASFGQIALVCSRAAIVTVTAAADSVLIRIEPSALAPIVEANAKLYDALAKVVADRLETVRKAQVAASAQGRNLALSVAEIRGQIERLFGYAPPPRRPS